MPEDICLKQLNLKDLQNVKRRECALTSLASLEALEGACARGTMCILLSIASQEDLFSIWFFCMEGSWERFQDHILAQHKECCDPLVMVMGLRNMMQRPSITLEKHASFKA